ncbi:MAG: hypothetical protein GX587_15735 [Bacteroidales bacterium]|nr:hypothetical protein [Bacteroidales bacterium]
MIELNGFDYQYLPGIILSENDSLLLDISTFLSQCVIPIFVALMSSIVAYSIGIKIIKNEQSDGIIHPSICYCIQRFYTFTAAPHLIVGLYKNALQ